jgi:hypothetical protein
MTLSVARDVGNRPSFLEDTCAWLKVKGLGVYAQPFYYGLDKLSYEQMHCTNPFGSLSVHEVGCQIGLICQWFKDMCTTLQHLR